MTGNDLLKAIGKTSDNNLAVAENASASSVKRSRSYRWLYAATAVLLLAGAFFTVSALTGKGNKQGTTISAVVSYDDLFKNVDVEENNDRLVFNNGLAEWLSYNDGRVHYSALEGEVISTRYFLQWLNDPEFDMQIISGGMEISEVRITRVPEELNKADIEVGSTLLVYEPICLTPDEEDFFELLSRKTGKSVASMDDLKEISSFVFEITPQDIEDFGFNPRVYDNDLPKEVGRSYFILLHSSADERLDEIRTTFFGDAEAIFFSDVSIPTDESYESLNERYGFRFDPDIELIAEELKMYFK